MTLTAYVLDTIKSDWTGSFPSDLKRINRDDSKILEDSERSQAVDLEDANYVAANAGVRDRTQYGVGVDRVEAVVEVDVQGLHADQFGQISDADEFETLVDDIKQVFRSKRFSIDVGSEDPATFVRLEINNEDALSNQYREHYHHEFNIRFIGERT